MKNLAALVTLMLASNPLWAQSFENLKPLDFNMVSLQAIKAVPVPEVKLPAVPSESGTRDSWKHVRLYAADGTVIAVDYSIVNLGGSVLAAPVWVNITNKAFGSHNKVRIILINYYDNQGGPSGQVQETQQFDLTPAGGTRYTGEAQKVVLSESHVGYGYNFRQEVAVVVDGQWLTTTQGNSHNFGFKMTWY
ncbi:MAG: hypothetical protein NTY45_10160 [Elusimicrobia bacterium]|nr:hypothetical protein [Elusimicrobiota bacterium]